ncbi:MAG: peroxiredoxin [Candidatus Dadabacteria bacterium]|nr:peroxiredoxin [Candidatus Dadabacteria bacterium]NIS10330.1 peroxiredoxin [Candidatus Dadabacteria bacterium]NIY23243.1 redoxin domain-containing protein [Candidatus Dadabacteria bacterium]
MSKLSVGDKAPQFEAQSYDGTTISLADYSGKSTVILYFYPRDNTPGCTKEACSMRDGMDDLSDLGVQVVGVSTDSVKSHEKFRDKFGLNFPLLSDKSKEIVKAYDVQSAFGTASRKSFLIDKDGVIRHIWNKVKTKDHANEVIEKVKELGL